MGLVERTMVIAKCDACGVEQQSQMFGGGPEVPLGWIVVSWATERGKGHVSYFHSIQCAVDFLLGLAKDRGEV